MLKILDQPLPPPPPTEQPEPEPARVITMYKTLVVKTDVWDEASMTDFLTWDPNRSTYPSIKNSMMYSLIPFGGGTEDPNPSKLNLFFNVPNIRWNEEDGPDYSDGTPSSYTRITVNVQVWLAPDGFDPTWGITRFAEGKFKWITRPASEYKEPTSEQLLRAAKSAVVRVVEYIGSNEPFTSEDYEALI